MAENLERIGTLAVEPLIETLEGGAAGQARVLAAGSSGTSGPRRRVRL
jgi:hypothetical protein